MFYLWGVPGFRNLKRKRVADALSRGETIFNGAPLGDLRGLDAYAYVEDLRVRRPQIYATLEKLAEMERAYELDQGLSIERRAETNLHKDPLEPDVEECPGESDCNESIACAECILRASRSRRSWRPGGIA
jgi:hypothetical protein